MAQVEKRPLEPDEPVDPPDQDEKKNQPLPNPPGKYIRQEYAFKFFEYLASLPKELWPRLSIYLWRKWPKINKPAPHHIEIYTAPVTIDRILHAWGAGVYTLTLCDLNRKQHGEVSSARLNLEDEDWENHPPIILPEHHLDENDPANAKYVQWIKAKGMYQTPNGQQTGGTASESALTDAFRSLLREFMQRKEQGAPFDQTFAKLAEMYQTAGKQAVEMAISQVKQSNPAEVLEMLTKAKDLFAAPAGTSGTEKLLELVIKMQTDHAKSLADAQNKQIELLTKLFESRAGPASGLAQVKELAETVTVLKEAFGGEGGGSRGGKWYLELAETAFEQIPVAVQSVADLVRALRGAQPVQAVPGAEEKPAIDQGKPPAAPVQPQVMLQQFGGMLLNALDKNMTGMEFAGFLVDMIDMNGGKGTVAYRQIAAMGKEGILAALRSIPPLWQQLEPLEIRLNEFIDGFLEYGQEPPDGDDGGNNGGDDDAPPKKPRKKAAVQ